MRFKPNCILVLLFCLVFIRIYPQKSIADSLDILYKRADEIHASENEELEVLLKTIWKFQDYRNKEGIDRILGKIEPVVKESEAQRVLFLFEMLNSRNFLHKHEYEKTELSLTKAFELNDNESKKEMVYLLSTRALVKYFKGDYVQALESNFEALKACNDTDDIFCATDIYNRIGVIYLMTNQLDKSEEYLLNAYEIADSVNYRIAKSRAIGNLAIIYTEKEEYDKAKDWYSRDLEMDIELGDSIQIAANYNNFGQLYDKQKDSKKSLEYYTKALEISKLINDKEGLFLAYNNVAWSHHKMGNNEKAEELYKLAERETRNLGNRFRLRDVYNNLALFYEENQAFKSALDYKKKYVILSDSLEVEAHSKALSELEIKYETQQKENELLKLSKQKQEDELVIARQNRRVRQLSFGLGAIALFGVLGFVLFRQRLQNKKQQELILAISETQSEERKRIAQDLHDSIGGSLALTKSKFEVAKKNLKAPSTEMDSALETLEQTTQQVRQISHNLMPGELVRFGLVAAINTLLENLNEEEINAQFHSNQGEERLEPLKEIQLYRIVQEALQNVLKHARANNLFIQLNKHQEHLTLMIEDDGKGIVQDSEEGMGLKNIKQRVQLLKGIFTIDSAPERGTILNIQIPV